MSFANIISNILRDDSGLPVVVVEGEPLAFDFSEWRDHLAERHVFWVAKGGAIDAHVRDASGELIELARDQCAKVWPAPVEGSRTVTVGGKAYEVPMVSPKLINKRKREPEPRFPARLVGLYVVEALPPAESWCTESVIHTVPIIYEKRAEEEAGGDDDDGEDGLTRWEILKAVQAERARFDDPLAGVATVEDLRKHPNVDVIMDVFNMVFPRQ